MNITTIVPYSGFTFWVVIGVLFLSKRIAEGLADSVALKNLVMITISFYVVSTVLNNVYLSIFLILFTILVFQIGVVLQRTKEESSRKIISIVFIALIIFVLSYFKYATFNYYIKTIYYGLIKNLTNVDQIPKHIFFAGISYFCFKYMHFLIECYKGKIDKLNLLTFINYILFFPSFFSGPINRYPNFVTDVRSMRNVKVISNDCFDALKRIVTGMFKKVVIANNISTYAISSLDLTDPSTTVTQLIIGLYAYTLYLYYDFSAYTDMAIGCGKMMGINLPENFNRPFLKRNIQQLWANMHMSLTSWLTEYVYWPLVKKMRKVKTLKTKPITISNICIIITFCICGIWHGDGINFFIWGLWHGFGLALLNIYTNVEKKYFSMKWKIFINKSKTGYCLSTLITFHYFVIGILFFACDIEKIKMFIGYF